MTTALAETEDTHECCAPRRSSPCQVLFGDLLCGYVREDKRASALQLFRRPQSHVPGVDTCTCSHVRQMMQPDAGLVFVGVVWPPRAG